MCSIVAVGGMGVRPRVQQLGEFFSFTDGPLMGTRSEETHGIHAVQLNTPSVAFTDSNDQDLKLHGHLSLLKRSASGRPDAIGAVSRRPHSADTNRIAFR